METPHPLPARPASSPWKGNWRLAENTVFLNHGSFGACPWPVLEAQRRLRDEMEANPVQFLTRNYDTRLDAARSTLADFIGADPANLAFVTNATTGVNAVVRSLPFTDADEILTTSLDYNACRNVLADTARRTGARLVVADVPFPSAGPDEVVAAILASVTPRTRLAVIDHVTSNSGMIYPLGEIVRALQAQGVDTLVDGAHAPGMLPLELEKLGAAYYTGNLHKWVCAPKGAAFLHVRPDKQDAIQPAVISHGNNRIRPDHSAFQNRFDWPATLDPTAWFCSADAIRWLRGFLPGGWPELRAYQHEMVVSARRMLCERLKLQPPCPEDMIGSMATLPMPGRLATPSGAPGPDPVYQRLIAEFGIELQVIIFGGRRWFRISAHLHNSPDEYRYLADVLEKLAGEGD
ncbi:MAG: aminotransferase class V-fold PLP-dependent enzyme [Verrucomicrobiaceae bacterium]|nr:MAG: aminotransferase class V-fold PLP-dependent enzyme [Verrucomicrobiaceae bacterium]